MNVLVACEESQVVCSVFRDFGFNAFSCDIVPCSGSHPEWHILGDVLPLLDGHCSFSTMDGILHTVESKWDLIIAHPPCTFLSNAGARHLWKNHVLNLDRYAQGLLAKDFFMSIYNADCDHIAIENPTPSKIYSLPKESQVIQPYQFGHPYTKRTLLWLKNLPLLQSTNLVDPIACLCPSGSYKSTHSDRHKGMFSNNRSLNRSKTFYGIAFAMASQWSRLF